MPEITIVVGARRVVHIWQHHDAAMSSDEAERVVRRRGGALATRYLNLMHELCG